MKRISGEIFIVIPTGIYFIETDWIFYSNQFVTRNNWKFVVHLCDLAYFLEENPRL